MRQVAVPPQDLMAHAAHVESISDNVATAAGTGPVGNDAYGKLCVMVPAMLNALQDVLTAGLRTTADSLADTGARLRTTANDYETTDRSEASRFGGPPR
ncbi:MAG: type VII secretion target [Actinoplanes sp.]